MTPNAELAWRVLDHIDAHPESWDQANWIDDEGGCGTAYCFAGWALKLSGHSLTVDQDDDMHLDGQDANAMDVRSAAWGELGMDGDLQEYGTPDLFGPENSRDDLGRLVAEIFGPRPGGAS